MGLRSSLRRPSISLLVTAFLVFFVQDATSEISFGDSPFIPSVSSVPSASGSSSRESELLRQIGDFLVEGSLEEFRRQLRQRLFDYAEEIKAAHGLPSVHGSGRRKKRGTIEADTLTTNRVLAARRRRNYVGKPGEFQIDKDMNYVVKRVFLLQEPSFTSSNVTDINYFLFGGQRYLCVVEYTPDGIKTIVYTITQHWTIEELGFIDTPHALKCEVMEIENHLYILPMTLRPVNETTLEGGSTLYRLSLKSNLKAIKVQTIDTYNAKSVLFWQSYGEAANDGLLCVDPDKEVTPPGQKYQLRISCYRWQGGYFDLNFHLPAYNPQAMDHMRITSHNYICIANYRDDTGSSAIHSSIYRYNHKKGAYLPFQRIRTNGARDCKFFKLDGGDQGKEYFLAVANYGHEDENGNVNYNVKSFIFKFAHGRFIFFQSLVTVGAFQLLPIRYEETFVLIVGEMHRLSIYQHNGWSFVKTRHIDFPEENLVNQFRMRPALHSNQSFFTVASPRLPSHTGIYAIEFEAKNDYTTVSADFEQWCNQALENVQSVDLEELAAEASSVSNTTAPQVVLKGPVVFSNALTARNITAQAFEVGKTRFDAERAKTLDLAQGRLQSLRAEKEKLKEVVQNAVPLNGQHVISTRIHFEELQISNSSSLETNNLNTIVIDGINVADILKRAVFLDQNYEDLGKFHANLISTQKPIQTKKINGVPVEDIILKNSTELQKLEANNTFLQRVIARSGFNVTGLLNGVNVSNILMYKAHQHFSELSISFSNVSDLQAAVVNGINVVALVENSVPKNGTQVIRGKKSFRDIQTDSIHSTGNISGFNITNFYENAVRTANITESTFTGKPVFDSLKLTSLTLADEWINKKYHLSGFVSSRFGNYSGGKWVIYNGANVQQLFITKSMNRIEVKNGRMNVLRKNTSDHQVVYGHNVNVLYLKGPSELNGTVNGMNLNEWEETKTIHLNNPNITGLVIAAHMTFPKGLTVKSLTQESNDVLQVLRSVIPTDKPLPCKPKSIWFESIEVDGNSQLGTINGQSPEKDWVLNDASQKVSINSSKNFLGDVVITQPSTMESLYTSFARTRDVIPLLRKVLLNGTAQTFTGRITFTDRLRLLSLNAPSDDLIVLDGIKLSDVLTTTRPNQLVRVRTILKSKTIVSESLVVRGNMTVGTLNGIKLEDVWEDTLKKESSRPQIVRGKSTFLDGLFLNNVNVEGRISGLTVHDLLGTIVLNGKTEEERKISGILEFSNVATIEAATFVDTINGILLHQWGNLWMTRTGAQDIYTPFHFTSLTVRNPQVSDGLVTGVDIVRLNDTILRKSVGGSLGHVQFQDVTFSRDFCSPLINGHNLPRDFLRKSIRSVQVVTGHKVLLGNWTVRGNLNVSHFEQLDWFNLARFAHGNSASEKLIVDGNCHSRVEPPPPVTIDGLEWERIVNNTWFVDRSAVIETRVSFDSLQLAGGSVNGLIDGVNVTKLQNEYLSRTRDQRTSGTFTFSNHVCASNLTAGKIIIRNGTLNGVDVKQLSDSTLRHAHDQEITSKFHVNSLSVSNLNISNGTLNGFDFCKDFVRVFGKNRISAPKSIESIDVDHLTLPADVSVNGIRWYDFIKNSVLTTGDYTLKGNRTFKSIAAEDLIVNGLVNGRIINRDTVMRRDGNQAGAASLTLKGGEAVTRFQNIHLNGTLNGRNLGDFFHNTVIKNGTEPIYIYGPVTMETPVIASWVQSEDRYEQHDVEVLQFLRNYRIAHYVNGTDHRDLKDKYEEMGEIVQRLLHIATEHAVLARCINEVPGVPVQRVLMAKPLQFNGEPALVVVQSETGFQTLQLWALSPNTDAYVKNSLGPVRIYGEVRDVVKVRGLEYSALVVLISAVNGKSVRYGISDSEPATKEGTKGVALVVTFHALGQSFKEGDVEEVFQADDFTHAGAFVVKTPTGKRACLLLGTYDHQQYEIALTCSRLPSRTPATPEFELLQRISLQQAPQVTSLTVGSKTMVILSDSNRTSNTRVSQSEFIKVLTFNVNVSRLVEEDCFPVMNVVTIDTILAPNYHPFLVVVSGRLRRTRHNGAIYIYRYSEETGRFSKFQTILEDNPIKARFQRLEPSDELVLYILTQSTVNNIHVYSFKGVSGWMKEHSFTSEGAHSLDTVDFLHRGDYKARMIATSPAGIHQYEWGFNGVTYVYEHTEDYYS